MSVRKSKKYAVVDLEATGTGSQARIIQIGIVLVENGEVVATYETDINPYQDLDSHIKELTGISDEQLRHAPDFGQVAGEIFDLIGDAIFVAHNVTFDANLLAEALFFEGYELLTPRVDTVELAQLFFPTLDKYSLSNLANQLGLELEQAHTAIADARATAQLLLAIQNKIAHLPKQTVSRILALADSLLYESRLVIEEVYEGMSDVLPAGFVEVAGLALKKPELSSPNRALSKDFAVNCQLLGLEKRPGQEEFAHIIEERVADKGRVHMVEAQAGLGKTYGYLLPLLAASDQQILLSLPTKILQEQVMVKEAQAIRDTFGVSVSSIKAAHHYLDLGVFAQTVERTDDHRMMNRCKMHLLVWLCETETGDLEEIRQWYPAYFEEIRHRDQVSPQALFGEWDFWLRAQMRASQSRLVVTNHAFLLHHAGKGQDFLDQSLLVIDEAQQLLLVAEERASQTIDLVQLQTLLQKKRDRSSQLLEKRLLEACLFEVEACLHKEPTKGLALPQHHLEELKRHLLELLDPDLDELLSCLTIYDQFWLEDCWQDGQLVPCLRASFQELLSVDKLLQNPKIFCVSATLQLGTDVSLADLLGFEEASFDQLPYQQAGNQIAYGLTDLPPLLEWKEEEHAAYIAAQLRRLAVMNQPILVLFTSISLLLAVSDKLEEVEVSHVAQHRHGSEHQLKKAFDKGEVKLLLGTGAFWQGVDFISHSQMMLVLTRFPFAHPEDRLQQKIASHLRQTGKSPFWDYSLPMMLLRVRQAMGRSNRSSKQLSAVVFLDPRIQGKVYSKQVRDYLDGLAPLHFLEEKDLLMEMMALFNQS